MDERRPGLLRASRSIAVALGPVVFTQGRRLRRVVPRLPDAAQPWHGSVAGPRPLRLLVLGDSTAAGVGAATQEEALPGRLGAVLRERAGRGIHWRAVGENGATARDLVTRYLDEALAEPADLLFLTIGANDSLALRGAGAFRRDVARVLDAVAERNPGAATLVSSLPVFGRFALLPQPLRRTLYRHSLALEGAVRELVARRPRTVMSVDPPAYADDFFATDLFHPSASGYRDWAEWAIDDAWDRGLREWLG
ncbi:MAG: SGNH/GDSL hydrolase family protein [Microbacteriaceae bacterium]|nr:SGNH/GDSL hydrolase family protein [Microbacteriaceae bacterium]